MDHSRLIRTVAAISLAVIALMGASLLTWTSWKKWQAKREYEGVREFAANLANDEFEGRFHRRPFRPETYEPELRDDRWHWGGFEPAGFFSAEVSFRRDATDPQVRIFWATDGPEPIEPIEQRFGSPPHETMPDLPSPYLIDK
jgi:hypothetical protein